MATILEFRPSCEGPATRPRSQRRRSRSAEIVIFPGVRYERWAEPEKKPDGKKPKARDVLKLVE
ncbi:MAG: hypothetical protein AB7F78_04655 [Hyphomicrobiaceae bacterium]